MSNVSVIVPARDASATLADTLRGLERQVDAPPFEVTVVDDGSRDTTAELARGFDVVTRVQRENNVGPARARNAGVAASSGPALAFIDADCVPSPRWLAEGVRALGEAELVQGAVQPVGPVGPFDRSLWVERELGLYESANLFVRRELFERLGGFESWITPRDSKELGEDIWFGWRARRAGARTAFCAQALALHAVFPRRPGGYLSERLRLRFFPRIAKRVPELRESLFFGRYFLSKRSAAFDVAVAGLAVAVARRRALPLLAAVPYAVILASEMPSANLVYGVKVTGVRVSADAVGAAALAAGSVRDRSLLI